MPTYEYACRSCGDNLEVVQSFKDDPLTVCPACGGLLRKVFGNIGIAFKGSGFYRNDSRAKTSSGAVKSGDATSGDTKSGDTKSGDSKSGDSKSGDSKSGDSKSGDTKSKPSGGAVAPSTAIASAS